MVDLVAARLLVIGDQCAKGGILLRNEALVPPHLRGPGGRIHDMGPRQRASGEPHRAAKHRTPCQNGHLCILPARTPPKAAAGAFWLLSSGIHYKAALSPSQS